MKTPKGYTGALIRRYSMVMIQEDGLHSWTTAESLATVNSNLDTWAKHGSQVTVVVIGPSPSGSGATTAIASRITDRGGKTSRFEFLQPQDRKQVQLWLLEEAKERRPEEFSAAASVMAPTSRTLTKAERERAKERGRR